MAVLEFLLYQNQLDLMACRFLVSVQCQGLDQDLKYTAHTLPEVHRQEDNDLVPAQ